VHGLHLARTMTQPSETSATNVPYVLRVVLSRATFWGCLLLGLVVAWIVPGQADQPWLPKLIIGWNVGAGVYLLFSAWQIFGKPRSSVRVLAVLQQDGWQLALGVALALVLLSLAGIVAELAQARALFGPERTGHLVLAGLTWMTAWAFTQVVFALQYAQSYFFAQVQGTPAVLTFADSRTPTYQDFLDVSVATSVMGRSATASFASPTLRRLGMAQRGLAVLFNLALLVLVINVVMGGS